MSNNPLAFIGKIYHWIWSHIGGRPWTFIIRDFCYENPLLLILTTVFIALWFLHLKHEILWLAAGILLGHLFWGTRYLPGQPGESKLKRLIGH